MAYVDMSRRGLEAQVGIALEASGMGTFTWDAAAGALRWSERLERIAGLEPGTFAGTVEDFLALVHPDDRERMRAEAAGSLAAGDHLTEYRIVRPGGGVRWLWSVGRVIEGSNGEPTGIAGVVLDVTERQRRQAALQRSEERFSAMAESAPALVWTATADGALTYVNRAWLEFTGRELDAELGEGWSRGVHPDEREWVLEAQREAIAAREPFEVEHRLGHRDGGYRWVVSRGSPVGGEADLAGLMGVCVDVHERRLERDRQRLLADVAETLDAELGMQQRLDALVGLLVDRVGDVCVVEMPGEDGILRRVASAARDPAVRTVADLRRESPMPADDARSLAAVSAGGGPVLVEEVDRAAMEAFIASAGTTPEFADALRRRPPRSVILAPLTARGRALGGLMVLAYDDRRLGPVELTLVTDIGRRAGVALDNARLFEQTRSSAQRLRLLQEATAALSSASTPEEVAVVVATHCRILLGATAASVYEVSGDHLLTLARENPAHPDDDRWATVPLAAPAPLSDAVRARSPVWIVGRAAWARAYPHLADDAARAGVASAAALALVGGEEVVGAIAASFEDERSFTEAERDLARAFAEASGQALARARLQRDAESQRRRAELLAEASFALDTSSNVRARLAGLLALVVPDIADLATVRLTDEGGGPPALAALAHVDAGMEALAWETLGRAGRPRGGSGAARVVQTGRPELIADVSEPGPADGALLDALGPLGVRSYASVPLTARGSVIGALTLMTTADSGRRYDRDDLELATELARRAGLAVDNAGRYEGEQVAREAAERSRRRTERLQRVSAALAAALTEEEVARAVVEEAMGALSAVAGVVVVREGDGGRVVVAAGYPPDLLASGSTFPLDASLPMAAVLSTGEELWLETAEDWTGRFGAPRRELGAAAIGLPLRVGGEIIGAIGFRFGQDARTLSPGDRNLVLAMAGQLAQAIERARLYESERRAAEVLQRSLLPASLPPSRAAQVEVRYLPAGGGRSGGDFYDAIELPDGRLSLVVGDVVGHGTEAAAVMGQLRSAWRAFALGGAGPASVAASLSGFAALLDGAAVATVACALLSGDELRYACAGHPPPLLRRPEGVAEYLEEGRGPPLATAARHQAEGRATLDPGALVLFYTDGVVERHRNIERGLAELAEIVGRLPADPGALLSRLAGVIGPEPDDDCALLALMVPERPEPLRIEIPADPAALRGARDGARGWLAASGVARGQADDVVLAISEALANGVEHAYADTPGAPGPVILTMSWGPAGRLLVEVADRGRWRSSGWAPTGRGRGLDLMRAVADSVDVASGADGTTVRLVTTTGRAAG